MLQGESNLQVPKEYELITAHDCLINIDGFLSHPNSKLLLLEAPSNVIFLHK